MRAIRVCIVVTTGIAAISLLYASLGAAESQPAAAKTPDLQQRVAALEEKVAQLEKKLDQFPSTIAPPNGAPRAPTAPLPPGTQLPQQTPQLPPGVPPNAVPREFNGQTYYIVPLTKGTPKK
jgi:hypothetical protein